MNRFTSEQELLSQVREVQAQISDDGDGIELIDLTSDNGGTFSVSSLGMKKLPNRRLP